MKLHGGKRLNSSIGCHHGDTRPETKFSLSLRTGVTIHSDALYYFKPFSLALLKTEWCIGPLEYLDNALSEAKDRLVHSPLDVKRRNVGVGNRDVCVKGEGEGERGKKRTVSWSRMPFLQDCSDQLSVNLWIPRLPRLRGCKGWSESSLCTTKYLVVWSVDT